jgi:hypothetical protein
MAKKAFFTTPRTKSEPKRAEDYDLTDVPKEEALEMWESGEPETEAEIETEEDFSELPPPPSWV